ncbi:hypothetical protein HDU97_006150 [Phlyctochytrium planicorne]|nr:hypothetical protein HDU97_006150 [Phlyctochytrium planicorne]
MFTSLRSPFARQLVQQRKPASTLFAASILPISIQPTHASIATLFTSSARAAASRKSTSLTALAAASTAAFTVAATSTIFAEPAASKKMSTAATTGSHLVLGEAEVEFGKFTYRMRLPASAPALDPKKPVLVFIHGLLVDSLLWDKTMDSVAQRGYQCVALDLPLGCHLHPVRNREELVFENVAKGMMELVKKIGVEKYTIVGNDTGGVVVQTMIRREIEGKESDRKIEGLIMTPCDCFENFLPPIFMPIIKFARSMPGTFHISSLGFFFTTPYIRNLPLALGWIIKSDIDATTANHLYTRMGSTHDIKLDIKKLLLDVRPEITLELVKHLHKFQRPTTVVVCPEDTKLFSFEYMNRFADALRRPLDAENGVVGYEKVRNVEITDSYAFVMVDQPVKLADAIVEHMKEHKA